MAPSPPRLAGFAAIALAGLTLSLYAFQLLVEGALGLEGLAPELLLGIASLAVIGGLAAHVLLGSARGQLSAMWPGLIFPAAFVVFHFGSLGQLARGWYNDALLPFAWLLSATCLLAWLCGHALARGPAPFAPDLHARFAGGPVARSDLRRLAWIGVASFALGLVAQLILLSRAGIGSLLSADYGTWKQTMAEAAPGLAAAVVFSMLLCLVGLTVAFVASALADRRLLPHPLVGLGVALYLLLLVAGGDRSEIATVAMIMLLARHYLVQPFRPRNALLLATLAAMAFAGIKTYRATKSVDDLTRSATDIETVVYRNADEAGGTLDVVVRSLEVVPGREPYFRGRSYLGALERVVPRVVRPGGSDFVSSVWITQETTSREYQRNWGLGFSIVAEAYINFGAALAPLVLFVFGLVQGRLERWLVGPAVDPLRVALFMLVHAAFLLHVRNSVILYVRGSIWSSMLVYGLVGVAWWLIRARAQAAPSAVSTRR